METKDQRLAAALAHALIAANWTGMAGAALIWLTERERSPEVGFQALQALLFQFLALVATWMGVGSYLVALAVSIPIGMAAGERGEALVGLVSLMGIPSIIFIPTLFLIYGMVGACRCLRGQPFEYALIGPVLRSRLGLKEAR